MSEVQPIPKFAAKALEALQTIAQSKNRVFRGNTASINSDVVERPLRQENPPTDSSSHFECYKQAAAAAKEAGNVDEEALYAFLSVLSSFWPDFTDRQHPFRPMMQMEGRRTLLPEDLHPEDIDVVATLFNSTLWPWLRARLGDVLWVLRRDHAAAREAATSYAIAGEQTATLEQGWTESVTLFLRGLQLAVLLGRLRDPFKSVAARLVDVVERLASKETNFRSARLMDLLFQFGVGESSHWAQVAEALAKPIAFLGSAVLALRKAIQALRQVGADESRIEELKARLREAQKSGMADMETFSQEVDLRPVAESAKANVTRKTFWSALIRFAFGYPVLNPSEVRQQVLDTVKEAPLSSILGTARLDADGRVKHQIPGLPLHGGPEFEGILQQHMFQHAARFLWPFRAQGYIEPARFVIWNEHHPNLNDLEPLVVHNPFIRPGHETFFLRGIHAGFVGDFLMASSLLVPQIEESLRYVLEQNNVDVSNLMDDDTQPMKLLGRLLSFQETKTIFGEHLQFELRGLLIEKAGFEFRNQIAHGFAQVSDCYSEAAINIWWLVLQILLRPVLTDADIEAVRKETTPADTLVS